MAVTSDKTYWREFFELYRDHPEIWNIKSDAYFNKKLKADGYNILLEKFKEINPDATIDYLKRKINSFRSSFRRELNKVKRIGKTDGNGFEDTYKPSLWYFEDLSFLKDQEISLGLKSTVETDEDETMLGSLEEPVIEHPKRKSKNVDNEQETKAKFFRQAFKVLNGINDEAEILSKAWAVKYRKLRPKQQMFAIKAIDNIFHLGYLEKLGEEMVENIPHPSSNIGTSSLYYEQASPATSGFRNFEFSESNQPVADDIIKSEILDSPPPIIESGNAESELTMKNDSYDSIESLMDDMQYS